VTSRIAVDLYGENEVLVRCRCDGAGLLAIVSLDVFERVGRDRSLAIVEELCRTCRSGAASS